MAIGTLGPITFSASSDKVQTFEEYNHEKTSRIVSHENLQNKPIVEFIGPGLDKISLKLTWSIEGKINPLTEISKLEEKQEKGEVVIFFLGGKPVGKGKYLIESISRAQRRVDNKGNLLSISFNVGLVEYTENARKETKIVTTYAKKKATSKSNNNSNISNTNNIRKKHIIKGKLRAESRLPELINFSVGSGAGGGGAGGF